jgi:hypothetical protein
MVENIGNEDMVFARPFRQLYRDMITPARLTGLINLTTLSGSENLCPSTGTLQKLMPTLGQTVTHSTESFNTFEITAPYSIEIRFVMT